MAKIAFILLCHKDPEAIVQQASRLTAAGDCVSIHFDARSHAADFELIRKGVAGNPNIVLVKRRVRCGWGAWSLVQATLNAVEAAVEAFPRATHFYMVSGDCMAIKSATYAHDFLDASDVDYIESFDYFESGWIKTGIREERLIYRHYFNERTHKWLFYKSLWLQEKMGLSREIPADLQIQIGSQWWCLRRRTIESILAFTKARRDVMRFFRTTWIPDETFFQTLVRHLVPEPEIVTRTLTFLMFTDYGMPVTFYNDHYELLISQDALFARKISPGATDLKRRLGHLYASGRNDFRASNEGRRLFAFLTGRGRVGRRFGARFWESETSLGRERELLIIACKKWHVAKRLVGSIKHHLGVPAVDYLFNEEATDMPDLGGIQATLAKRTRHRRALMRMLFAHFETERLIICLDTSSIDLMQDFYSDRSVTRLLDIECEFSDDYLIGHAQRVGLAGPEFSKESFSQLIPTLRLDIQHEVDQIGDARFPNRYRLRENATAEQNAAALAGFLTIDEPAALSIAQTPYLFND